MQERQFAIATPSGNMDTFIVHPSAGGSHPAVVLYMDVWGMREDIRECAEATSVNSGIPYQSFFQFPTARPNYLSNLLPVSH